MRILIILSILLIPIKTYAEPSSSVTYLMNEPFSLFDWGLYKLEDSLKDTKFKDLHLIFRTLSSVDYEWNKNVINITLTIYPSYSSLSKGDPKKICRSALTSIKERYGFGWEKDIRFLVSIKRFFQHKGYEKKDEPKTLMEDLEAMTKITVQVLASETDKPAFSKQASCISRLLEEEIFFLDTEDEKKP